MPLETGSFINDLTVTNPAASDPVGQGDDHLRLIKSCVQGSLPNLGGIIGQPRNQDSSTTISSTWNTGHIVVSATGTVVLTTPPVASITSGFYVDFTTLVNGQLQIVAGAGTTVNGLANVSVPQDTGGRLFYRGTNDWRVAQFPAGGATNTFPNNVFVGGTLSVSGATVLSTLKVNGGATFSSVANFQRGISISGSLVVTGDSVFTGNAVFTGSVSISAAAVFTGSLLSNGNAAFAGSVSISGQTFMKSNLQVDGPGVFTGSLSVSGVAIFDSAITGKSTMQLNGFGTFKDSVSISGGVAIGGALGVTGQLTQVGFATFKDSVSISGNCAMNTLSLNGGQIAFPAAQNASAGANVLDDYEEGTFTPTITFATPGNLNVVYSTQTAFYTKVGRAVHCLINIQTSTFTHTTASGNALIGTLPFTPQDTAPAATDAQNISLATHVYAVATTVGSSTSMLVVAMNHSNGASRQIIAAAQMPTAGTVIFNLQFTFRTT